MGTTATNFITDGVVTYCITGDGDSSHEYTASYPFSFGSSKPQLEPECRWLPRIEAVN